MHSWPLLQEALPDLPGLKVSSADPLLSQTAYHCLSRLRPCTCLPALLGQGWSYHLYTPTARNRGGTSRTSVKCINGIQFLLLPRSSTSRLWAHRKCSINRRRLAWHCSSLLFYTCSVYSYLSKHGSWTHRRPACVRPISVKVSGSRMAPAPIPTASAGLAALPWV